MPLGPGVRYRVKKTSKGNIRLAFRGDKVVEAVKMPPGKDKKASPMQSRLADMKMKGKFKKNKKKAPNRY